MDEREVENEEVLFKDSTSEGRDIGRRERLAVQWLRWKAAASDERMAAKVPVNAQKL
jgi:hypothetical protein